jgi:Putative methionine and alanine importer, small subunit
METSAVAMMVIGMVIIWGGLAASVVHAVKKSRS